MSHEGITRGPIGSPESTNQSDLQPRPGERPQDRPLLPGTGAAALTMLRGINHTEAATMQATALLEPTTRMWSAGNDIAHAWARLGLALVPNGLRQSLEEEVNNHRDAVDLALAPMRRLGTAATVFTEPIEPGCTESEVVCETKDGSKLRRYGKFDKNKKAVLWDQAPMSDGRIVDLKKGASLMQYFLDHGYQPYFTEWAQDANTTYGDVVLKILPEFTNAMQTDRVKEDTDKNPADVEWYGGAYCLGTGTLMAFVSTLSPEEQPKGISLLTPPIEFPEEAGKLAKMVRDGNWNLLDAMMHANGEVMPEEAISSGAENRSWKSSHAGLFFAALQVADKPEAIEALKRMYGWSIGFTDGKRNNPGIPRGIYEHVVKDFYWGDKLARNEFKVTDSDSGEKRLIDLDNIQCPVHILYAGKDDVAHPNQSIKAGRLFTGSKRVEVDEIPKAGHIAVVTNRLPDSGSRMVGFFDSLREAEIRDIQEHPIRYIPRQFENGEPRGVRYIQAPQSGGEVALSAGQPSDIPTPRVEHPNVQPITQIPEQGGRNVQKPGEKGEQP